MSWIKCDSKVKAKCVFKNKCCGDHEGVYLDGSECDKFAQKVLAEPPTNADRIRAMSDKELAHWINLNADKDFAYEHCCTAEWRKKPCNNKCVACLVAWLQQPAEEVDHE